MGVGHNLHSLGFFSILGCRGFYILCDMKYLTMLKCLSKLYNCKENWAE